MTNSTVSDEERIATATPSRKRRNWIVLSGLLLIVTAVFVLGINHAFRERAEHPITPEVLAPGPIE